jgi:MscS family membrane protein
VFSILAVLDQTALAEITLGHLVVASVVAGAAVLLRGPLAHGVLHALLSLAGRARTRLDDHIVDAMRRPIESAIVLAGVALALAIVPFPRKPVDLRLVVHHALVIASALVGAWILFRAIDAVTGFLSEISQQTDSKLDHALVPMLRKLLKFFVGVLVFVVAIQNLGYSVSGLVAGLGIGGLAVALAAKDTLANVFASITLLVDRPFKVGDWVRSAQFEGVVEEIGFRSTRIRTFDRTLVVVPNNHLTDAVIDNRQAMPARRIALTLALSPETGADRLESALAEIARVVDSVEGIAPEGRAVRLQDLTPSAIEIAVRAFTGATDDATHGAIRAELLLRIVRALETQGVRPAGAQAAERRS